MKLLAVDDRRPTDSADLRVLSFVARADDWAVAEEAAEIIVARSFNRGRDLIAAVLELRAV